MVQSHKSFDTHIDQLVGSLNLTDFQPKVDGKKLKEKFDGQILKESPFWQLVPDGPTGGAPYSIIEIYSHKNWDTILMSLTFGSKNIVASIYSDFGVQHPDYSDRLGYFEAWTDHGKLALFLKETLAAFLNMLIAKLQTRH